MRKFWFILFLLTTATSLAQFDGSASSSGTKAIHKDSNVFVAWANQCVVNRGFLDISDKNLGFADYGVDVNGTLKAGVNDFVSLGDSGIAILTFPRPITNEIGPDFAIFENGFDDRYLELAFVEVSSNGIDFFRFPSVSNSPIVLQVGPFDLWADPTQLNNLAGKYRVDYGTPFDLDELNQIPNLDINAITHVKIIDVIGILNAPSTAYDSQNNPINDPYPTPYPSSGFDLDAVGVIHQLPLGIAETENHLVKIYPNPVRDELNIELNHDLHDRTFQITDLSGRIILAGAIPLLANKINVSFLQKGQYILRIEDKFTFSIIVN